MDAHSARRRLMLSRHRTPMRRPRYAERSAPDESSRLSVRERFAAELERAKLDAMKELAYGASHEINNPLANIALRAQTLLKRESDADKRRALEAMHRGAMRAHEMISDLMLFARPPKLERAEVDVVEICRSMIEEFSALSAARSIRLQLVPSRDEVWARVDPVQFAVVTKSLLENAIEAIGSEGVVQVSVSEACGSLEIAIDDDGPGIPSEIRPFIFDPFFSGREAGRGLGFGLSKCWRIVTDHDGVLSVRESSLGGAGFRVTIPNAAPT